MTKLLRIVLMVGFVPLGLLALSWLFALWRGGSGDGALAHAGPRFAGYAAAAAAVAFAIRAVERWQQRQAADAARYDGGTVVANRRLGGHVVLCIAMAVLGGWVLAIGLREAGWQPFAIALPLLLLAGWCLRFVLSQRRRGAPTLVLDAEGIDHAWYGPIPWTAILGVTLRTFDSQYGKHHELVFGVAQPERWLGNTPWLVRRMRGLGRLAGAAYGDLSIPLDHLDQSPQRIDAAARALRAAVEPPPMALWYPGMRAQSIETSRALDAFFAEAPKLDPEAASRRYETLQPMIQAEMAATQRDLRRQNREFWIVMSVLAAAMIALIAWGVISVLRAGA